MTGFLKGSTALGRPVDVIFDSKGSLYISDDKAGAVYKLTEK
jgi:glucose/arabinose dehydrogenase